MAVESMNEKYGKVRKDLFIDNNDHEIMKKGRNHFIVYVLVISLLILALYSRFIAPKNDADISETSQWVYLQSRVITKEWIEMMKEKDVLSSFITPVSFGLITFIFTWMMTFLDSSHPGKCPPSPLSPAKLRKMSGHTFHCGYILALLNGFACSLLMSRWV